jgi:hypothetical protein
MGLFTLLLVALVATWWEQRASGRVNEQEQAEGGGKRRERGGKVMRPGRRLTTGEAQRNYVTHVWLQGLGEGTDGLRRGG